MHAWLEALGWWAIDFQLLAALLLGAVCAAVVCLRQPAHRVALAWATSVGLLILALLTSLPGWPRANWLPASMTADTTAADTTAVDNRADDTRARDRLEFANTAGPSTARDAANPAEMWLRRPAEFSPVGRAADGLDQSPVAPAPTGPAEIEPPTAMPRLNWPLAAGALIATSAALSGAWLLLGIVQAAQLRRRGRPVPAALVELLDRVIADHVMVDRVILDRVILDRVIVGARRRPLLLASGDVNQPLAMGLARPVIVLPDEFVSSGPAYRVAAALAHEWAHIHHGDLWLLALSRLLLPLLAVQPLFWWLRRVVRDAQEELADAAAASRGDRFEYAEILLSWARSSPERVPRGMAGSLALWERPSQLKRRVLRLLQGGLVELRCSRRRRLTIAVATLVAVALLSLQSLRPAAVGQPPAVAQDAVAEPPSAPESDVVTVTGQVLDPNGQPVAGARIFAARWYWEPQIPHPPLAESASTADGHFTISFRKSQFNVDVAWADQWKNTDIVATAPGFGPSWIAWRDIPAGDGPTLRLVADDLPVTGRVVDLEGSPIAGVTVRIGSVQTGKDGSLDGWLAAVRRGEFPWTAARHLDSLPQFDAWPPRVITGSDGRFRIDGIGRERRVHLSFAGPTIAYQEATAVTRQSDTPLLNITPRSSESTTEYGADFELAAQPTQPISGVVRDAKTRRPIAGVSVESWRLAGSNYVDRRVLRVVTDEAGRYRLIGMPKGEGNRLLAVPDDDQPYFMREVNVPDLPGLEPVSVDIDLHRGVWITGRVTDKTTGEPVAARLHYLPFLSNSFANTTPEFDSSGNVDGFQTRYTTRTDGSFRLVGLPGRAIVGAGCVARPYRRGAGSEAIEGMNEHGTFETYMNPVLPGKRWPSAMREINPPAGAETVVCDLALDPGETMTVNVVGPDGKPLDGFDFDGRTERSEIAPPAEKSAIDIINLGPNDARTLVIHHEQRKVGKVVRLRLADHPSRATTIMLESSAKIVGRLLDRNGDAVSGAEITARVLPSEDFGKRLSSVTTDDQGQFEYADVPTGCDYSLGAEAGGLGHEPLARKLTLAPGETRDLGDVTFGEKAMTDEKSTAPPVNETKPAKDAAANDTVTVRGRVFDAQGKPLAGAKLYLWYPNRNNIGPQLLGASGANGQFEFRVDKSKLDTSTMPDPWSMASITATAEGFGLDWVDAAKPDGDGNLAIHLVNDVAIHGRVLTFEGRPVVGATVRVRKVGVPGKTGIDGYLEAFRDDRLSAYEFERETEIVPGQPDIVETDESGRFSVRGFGAERIVELFVKGPAIAHWYVTVMTREVDAAVLSGETWSRRQSQPVYGATFDYLAPTERRIAGTVRDAATGRPLADVKVHSLSTHEPVTDDHGRFELLGHAKAARYQLTATLSGGPYLSAFAEVADAPGLNWVKADIELHRGIEVRGRVTEAPSGEAVKAYVSYYPLSGNKHASRLGPELVNPVAWALCEADGRFTLPTLPGPGVLTVTGENDRYTTAYLSAQEVQGFFQRGDLDMLYWARGMIVQSDYHALALINPAEDEPSSTRDIVLDRADAIGGSVVGPDGKGLSGVLARGLTSSPFGSEVLPTAAFSVRGVNPRRGRPLVFEHNELGLGCRQVVRGDETGPLVVRLQPCGALKGRLVDADGDPIRRTTINFGRLRSDPADSTVKTDGEGKFRIAGLVPAQPYEGWLPNDTQVFHEIVVRTGETKDLGDLAIKPPAAPPGDENPKPGAEQQGQLKPKDESQPEQSAKTGDRDAQATDAKGIVTIHGRVHDEENRPVAEANVAAFRSYTNDTNGGDSETTELLGKARSDAEGGFALKVPVDTERFASSQSFLMSGIQIVATASGHGVGCAWLEPPADAPTVALKLVADTVPVEGRLLDLEGRPISGVRVIVRQLMTPRGSIDEWLEKARKNPTFNDNSLMDEMRGNGEAVAYFPSEDYLPLRGLPLFGEVVSDAQGMFQLAGIGNDRLVEIELRGPTIVATRLHVLARQVRPVALPSHDPRYRIQKCFGAKFDVTLEPTQPIAGLVREAGTGRPLPAVEVKVEHYAGSLMGGMDGFLSATTDAEGRYDLRGMPKPSRPGVNIRLRVQPAADQPYFRISVNAPHKEGLDAVTCDIDLKPAIWVHGQVTDRRTGKPLRAIVAYFPFLANAAAASYPNFAPGTRSVGTEDHYVTDIDGRFRIPALPGRGVVVARAREAAPYPLDEGAKRIDGLTQEQGPLWNVFHTPGAGLFNAVREIDPPEGADEYRCDISLPPLHTIRLDLVDVDGRALTDVETMGLRPWRGSNIGYSNGWEALAPRDTMAELISPMEGQRRCVLFLHRPRKLSAAVVFTAENFRDTKDIKVTLRPSGSIVGRLVDPDGRPLAGAWVTAVVEPDDRRWHFGDEVARKLRAQTENDGRFRVEPAPAGARYRLEVATPKRMKEVTLTKPGETVDIGDWQVSTAEKE